VLPAFLVTRVGIWAVALGAAFGTEPGRRTAGEVVGVWSQWDAKNLLSIAHGGYGSPYLSAWYPLYPGGARLVAWVFVGHYALAGVVVALGAAIAAFVLLFMLAEQRLGPDGARRAVLYLALFPTSLYLQAAYAESIYLVLALAVFLLAERGSFTLAGVAAGAALLTRPTGVALLPALAVMAWRSPRRPRALGALAIAPALFLVYPLVLWLQLGDPWLFVHAETHSAGHRYVSSAGPFGGLWDGTRAGWAAVEQLASGSHTHRYWADVHLEDVDPIPVAIEHLHEFLACLLFLGLAVVVWRRLPLQYGLFTLVSLALPLATPTSSSPLLSLPRFGMVVFPLFLGLADLGRHRWVHLAVLAVFSLGLLWAVVYWGRGSWVA
jgi:hypothetical protein